MSEDRDPPAGTPSEEGSFLSRWSRRKQEAKQSGEQHDRQRSNEPGPATPTAKKEVMAPAPSGRPDEELIDLATLPKLEDLTPASDFSVFLRKGVPEELKRLALRKLWTLDPAIRDFVEVAENQYNWNDPHGVPGFGPLDESTDIEKLLAQATGQTPPSPEPAPEPAPARVAEQPSRTDAARPSDEPESRADPDRSEQSSDDTIQAAAKLDAPVPADDENLQDRDQEPREQTGQTPVLDPPRRRHGGALPA